MRDQKRKIRNLRTRDFEETQQNEEAVAFYIQQHVEVL
jgi:hypothetical protein